MSVKFGVNKAIYAFSFGLILIIFINCKKEDAKISHKVIVSDSMQTDMNSVQIRIDSVFYDTKNAYFKVNIQNNSARNYYFPVDFDYSYQFNYRFKKTDTLYYSFFYTKYFDKSHNQILGNIVFYDWDTAKRRKIIDSLKVEDSIYKTVYGVHPNKETMERHLWGIKYHGIKKNGFFLKPEEQIELIVQSHFKENPRAYASSGITYFSSREIEEIAFAQLILKIDSSQIKRDLLLPKDIDSLHKNHIKIFNGKIFSNKIPMKLEYEK